MFPQEVVKISCSSKQMHDKVVEHHEDFLQPLIDHTLRNLNWHRALRYINVALDQSTDELGRCFGCQYLRAPLLMQKSTTLLELGRHQESIQVAEEYIALVRRLKTVHEDLKQQRRNEESSKTD